MTDDLRRLHEGATRRRIEEADALAKRFGDRVVMHIHRPTEDVERQWGRATRKYADRRWIINGLMIVALVIVTVILGAWAIYPELPWDLVLIGLAYAALLGLLVMILPSAGRGRKLSAKDFVEIGSRESISVGGSRLYVGSGDDPDLLRSIAFDVVAQIEVVAGEDGAARLILLDDAGRSLLDRRELSNREAEQIRDLIMERIR